MKSDVSVPLAGLALAALWLGPVAFGQEGPPAQEPKSVEGTTQTWAVSFRVLAVVAGPSDSVQDGILPPGDLVRVDRGQRDGVGVGDPVEFSPKGGVVVLGTVVGTEERSCLVQLRLADQLVAMVPGVGGSVTVRTRLDNLDSLGSPVAKAPEPTVEVVDERPAWQQLRDSWTKDMPLLARVNTELPEGRAPAWGGRMYLHSGLNSAFSGERGDAAFRSGLDIWSSNPFGAGGEAELDMEYDLRSFWVPEQDGEDEGQSRLRVDRISYSLGGTRHKPEGHRWGRFLQTLPELGAIDGYEWTRRLTGGDSFGASLGYLVERDFDAGTGNDFATSAFYSWVADEREVVSGTAAVSKSFHNGKRDRDLIVLRGDYFPRPDVRGNQPWDLHMSMSVDRYSNEDASDDGLALSLLNLTTRTERLSDTAGGASDSLQVHFAHQEYPEALLFVQEPLTLDGLIREREDRIDVSTSYWARSDRRVHGFVGLWSAGGLEADTGGDLELGLEALGVQGYGPGQGGGIADATVFVSHGRFNTTTGFHCSYGRHWDGVGWEVLYEFMLSDQDGFTAATDDIYQHRLRLVGDLAHLGGWNVAAHGDLVSHGDDSALSIGVFLGRSF